MRVDLVGLDSCNLTLYMWDEPTHTLLPSPKLHKNTHTHTPTLDQRVSKLW